MDSSGLSSPYEIRTTDTTVTIGFNNPGKCIICSVNVYAVDRNDNVSGKSNTVIDGWWSEECGPNPLMASIQTNQFNRDKSGNASKVKVYDASGRLIYEGEKSDFKFNQKGVFFILGEGGKITKEVRR